MSKNTRKFLVLALALVVLACGTAAALFGLNREPPLETTPSTDAPSEPPPSGTDTAPTNSTNQTEHIHTYTKEVIVPDCIHAGYTQYQCACGDSYIADQVAPLGHRFGGWKVTTPATEEAAGEQQRTCDVCGHMETEIIAALSHVHSYITQETVNATCTAAGSTAEVCEGCGDTRTTAIPAQGHRFGSWFTSVVATCQTAGQERRNCSSCDHFEVRDIAMQHNWTTQVIKQNTCLDEGSEQRTCNTCGLSEIIETPIQPCMVAKLYAIVDYEYTWMYKEPGVISHFASCGVPYEILDSTPVKGYEAGVAFNYYRVEGGWMREHFFRLERRIYYFGEHITYHTVDPSCAADGYIMGTCAICGKSDKEPIPTLGHELTQEWVVTLEPTCGTDGSEETVCARCEETVTRVIAKTKKHNWVEITLEPTCDTDGRVYDKCTLCGAEVLDHNLLRTGHDWSEWEITIEPAANRHGEKQRTCGKCKETQIVAMPVNFETGELYETYIDPRITAEAKFGDMYYEYKSVRIIDKRSWATPVIIHVNTDEGVTIIHFKADGTRVTSVNKQAWLRDLPSHYWGHPCRFEYTIYEDGSGLKGVSNFHYTEKCYSCHCVTWQYVEAGETGCIRTYIDDICPNCGEAISENTCHYCIKQSSSEEMYPNSITFNSLKKQLDRRQLLWLDTVKSAANS